MIVSKAKTCAYVCHSSIACAGFWIIIHVRTKPCLEYGYLLYYGTANTHLCHLDSLQQHAASICSTTFPSLSSCCQAAAISLICRLLDGEGHANVQTFCPHFATHLLEGLLVYLQYI